jgi:hypothetical protein
MQVFPQITPWNAPDLQLKHYLAMTAAVDARRQEARRG